MAKHRKQSNVAASAKRVGTVATGSTLALAIGASPALASHEWEVIAECESGNRNVENTQGSSASGYFQIIDGTWKGAGGGEFAPRAIQASYDEQLEVAKRIAEARGSLADWNASKSCWGNKISSAVPAEHAAPKPKPAPKPAPAPAKPKPAPPVQEETSVNGKYTVKPGDTLVIIGNKLNIKWQTIAKLNNIGAPYTIYPGEVLKTQAEPVRYTVKPGDWLSTIAPRFDMTTQELYKKNKTVIGDNPDLIFPGQVFFVAGLPLANPPIPVAAEETPSPAIEEAADNPKPAANVAYAHPLPNGVVTSEYGPRGGSFHDGIDIAAPAGSPIYAAAAGEVVLAGPASGFDQWVLIRTLQGEINIYGHINANGLKVKAGQSVVAGQHIADVGRDAGVSTGDHLHFRVHVDDAAVAGIDRGLPVNPRTWLANRGINLS